MKRKYFIVVILLIGSCIQVHGQRLIKGFEFIEVVRISETYRRLPDLSFNLLFTYTSSDSATGAEVMAGSYKIHNKKYLAVVEQTEVLQGNNYNISLFNDDSIIIVTYKKDYPEVMQMPLMDSLFRARNVDSVSVEETGGTLRKLQIFFRPESRYTGLEINYDRKTYLINSMVYYIKETYEADGEMVNGTGKMEILFSDYSTAPVSDSFFNEQKYVYEEGGQLLLQPAYEGFHLMVNMIK